MPRTEQGLSKHWLNHCWMSLLHPGWCATQKPSIKTLLLWHPTGQVHFPNLLPYLPTVPAPLSSVLLLSVLSSASIPSLKLASMLTTFLKKGYCKRSQDTILKKKVKQHFHSLGTFTKLKLCTRHCAGDTMVSKEVIFTLLEYITNGRDKTYNHRK